MKKIAVVMLIVFLVTSIGSTSALAQQGTTIPGSGSPTDSPSGAETTEGAGTTKQGNGGKECGGFLDCAGDAAGHFKNSYISLGQSAYNFANPFNSEGGKKELEEAKSQREDAAKDAESAKDQIPGTWEIIVNTIGKAVAAFVNMVLNVIDGILWSIFSLPAPGQAFDPGTWFLNGTAPLSDNATNISNATIAANNSSNSTQNVTAIQPMVEGGGADRSVLPAGLDFNAWWTVVWKAYAGIAGIMSFLLLIIAVFTLSSSSLTPRERNQRLRDTGISFLLVVFGPIIMPAILHFGNIFVAGLLPDAGALLDSPGDMLKIGSAVGFAALGGHIATGAMAIGLAIAALVGFGQWILTFLLASTWILWAPLYGSQNGTLKAWSRMGFASLGILVALKIVQAFLFWVLWKLPVTWGEPAESIVSLLIFPIGLWVIFYKLPKGALERAVPSVVSSISTGGGRGFTYDNSASHNYIHNIGDSTNNPDPGGDDPDDSSDNNSGGGSGGGGGGGGGGLSILNPFSSGEGENGESNGRSRIRDWTPDSLFGGGDGSTPGEGTNTPDGSTPAVLNSAGHDDRSDQSVTAAEAEDAGTRVGSRDEEMRPEMAEAVAGEADEIPPEEVNEDPAAFEIEDPESVREADNYTPRSGIGPVDEEIPPESEEPMPDDTSSGGGDEDGFAGTVPPEYHELIEESTPPDGANLEEYSSSSDGGTAQSNGDTNSENIPNSVDGYLGNDSERRARDREHANEMPASVSEFFESNSEGSDSNNEQASSNEMPNSVSDFFANNDSEGRTRSRGPDLGNGLESSGDGSGGGGQADSGGE